MASSGEVEVPSYFPMEKVTPPPKTSASGVPIKLHVIRAMAKQHDLSVKADEALTAFVQAAEKLDSTVPPPAPVAAKALKLIHGDDEVVGFGATTEKERK